MVSRLEDWTVVTEALSRMRGPRGDRDILSLSL